MLYRVVADGIDILDFAYPDLVLLSPNVEMELDSAGSFEFTVPPTHRYYGMFDMASIMSMTVEVYEDQILHFFGRPVELHLDFYKNKKVYCEGALSYFNDSVQRKKEYEDTTFMSDFFQDVIDNHNSMVPDNRKFTIGSITVPDHTLYRKIDYEQTSDVLKSKLLDAEEGHFFFDRVDGTNYISFLKDDVMPYTCNQDVTFGENLLDFTYSFDGKDFATCVMPIGSIISESEGGDGEPLTIASVNSGSDILVGNSAANFGQIVKVQHYSDIKDATELMEEAQKYLTKVQYNATLIECSTLDLHSLDNTKVLFRIGQNVHCVSFPHSIEIDLPVSKLSLQLDSAEKQITLGRIPKKTLSRFYKEVYDRPGDDYGDYGGYGGWDDGWQIVPPSDPGGTPTMRKVPTNITINNPPSIRTYEQGSTINFGGLSIKLWTPETNQGPLVPYTDDNYPTGIITYPSNELILPVTKVVQQTSQIKIPVQWRCPYTGQLLVNYFTINNATAAAIEQAHGGPPDHIEAFVTKLGGVDPQVYKNGDRIHLNGVKVYAFWPDGTRYDANGYKDGYIPNTEITFTPKFVSNDVIIDSSIEDQGTDVNGYIYYWDTNSETVIYDDPSHLPPGWNSQNRTYDWMISNGAIGHEVLYGIKYITGVGGSNINVYGPDGILINQMYGGYGTAAFRYIRKIDKQTGFEYYYYALTSAATIHNSHMYALKELESRPIDYSEVGKLSVVITVNWKSPNGTILSTTYSAKVRGLT